jgi:hypothetical protein
MRNVFVKDKVEWRDSNGRFHVLRKGDVANVPDEVFEENQSKLVDTAAISGAGGVKKRTTNMKAGDGMLRKKGA